MDAVDLIAAQGLRVELPPELDVVRWLSSRERFVVFKKMLGAFGVGGPSVDTVLSNPSTRPGLMLAVR